MKQKYGWVTGLPDCLALSACHPEDLPPRQPFLSSLREEGRPHGDGESGGNIRDIKGSPEILNLRPLLVGHVTQVLLGNIQRGILIFVDGWVQRRGEIDRLATDVSKKKAWQHPISYSSNIYSGDAEEGEVTFPVL